MSAPDDWDLVMADYERRDRAWKRIDPLSFGLICLACGIAIGFIGAIVFMVAAR